MSKNGKFTLKIFVLSLLGVALASPAFAQTATRGANRDSEIVGAAGRDFQAVSPALDRYIRDTVYGDLWRRTQLSPRDRNVVTLAVAISRNQAAELPVQLRLALDNGVTPREISEIITHLAFYAGLGNAREASLAAKAVFVERGIGLDQLPPAAPQLLPIDEAAEARRAARVEQDVGSLSPGLTKFTGDLLFQDLWLRPDLARRDRSLITVASLMANGQVGQIAFHLNKAMDNGLTADQAGELIVQVAFYAGWPAGYSAVSVVADVLKSRRR